MFKINIIYRKKREWGYFILLCFVVAMFTIMANFVPPYTYIFYFAVMICSYEAIRGITTYDITKWGNSRIWILLGGIFGVLGSLIVYLVVRTVKKRQADAEEFTKNPFEEDLEEFIKESEDGGGL